MTTDAQRHVEAIGRAFDASEKLAVRLAKERGVPLSTDLLHEAHLMLADELTRQGHTRIANALRDVAVRVRAEVAGEAAPTDAMTVDPDSGHVVFLSEAEAEAEGIRAGELDEDGNPLPSPHLDDADDAAELVTRWRERAEAEVEAERAAKKAERAADDQQRAKRKKARKAAKKARRKNRG